MLRRPGASTQQSSNKRFNVARGHGRVVCPHFNHRVDDLVGDVFPDQKLHISHSKKLEGLGPGLIRGATSASRAADSICPRVRRARLGELLVFMVFSNA